MILKKQLRIMENDSVFTIKGTDENGIPYVKYKIWKYNSTIYLLFERETLKRFRMDVKLAFNKGLRNKEYLVFNKDYKLYEYLKDKL